MNKCVTEKSIEAEEKCLGDVNDKFLSRDVPRVNKEYSDYLSFLLKSKVILD